MKRVHLLFAALFVISGLLMAGCSSSEEASAEDQQTDQEEFRSTDSRPDVVPSTDKPTKETQELPATEKDLPIQVEPLPREVEKIHSPAASQKTGLMMWSVQIGAFKAESGALQLINEAKKKFNQPVYKDYDPVSGFYKVNLGSFAKREDASQFKSEVQSNGYPDAFTVEVRR